MVEACPSGAGGAAEADGDKIQEVVVWYGWGRHLSCQESLCACTYIWFSYLTETDLESNTWPVLLAHSLTLP